MTYYRWLVHHRPLVLLLGCVYGIAAERPPLISKSSSQVYDEVAVFDRSWGLSSVEDRLRVFFETHRNSKKLYRLILAPTEAAALAAAVHTNEYERDPFKQAVATIGKSGFPLPVAEVIGVGPSAVMRYRDGERLEIRNWGPIKNPLLFKLSNGAEFELLHFHVAGSAEMLKKDGFHLGLYFRSRESVSLAMTVALLKQVRAWIPAGIIEVNLRPDPWFFESPSYPLIYVFDRNLRIPTEAEFRLAGSANCAMLDGFKIRCSGQNFVP